MAQGSITLTVKVAWWVRWYIQSVSLFAKMTGMTPDLDNVAATVMRGMKVKVGR